MAFRMSLIRDVRFPGAANDILVEFGKRAVDRRNDPRDTGWQIHGTVRPSTKVTKPDGPRHVGSGLRRSTRSGPSPQHAAYGRIEAARAARKFPVVLDVLSDGSLTLTAVTLLAPLLTPANHRDVLNEAHHKSKRDVEHLVARLRPQPAVPVTVRKLPASAGTDGPIALSAEPGDRDDSSQVVASPPRPATVSPLAPERYKVQFTVSRETHDKLRRAQDLLRHAIPNGDAAAIFDRALTVLLADLEQAKFAATARPRAARSTVSGSRYIPAAVRREVWKRDGGQCTFVGTHGRCTERGFLEFHHLEPYADGGAMVAENLALRCRAHNLYEAEQYFGNRLPLLVREGWGPAYCARPGPGRTESATPRSGRDQAWTATRAIV